MEPNLFQYGVVAFILSLITQSNCRDLRPSDHGLAYQEGSPRENGTLAFFGGATPPPLPLPEARNISDTWGNEDGSRRSDHLKIGLLVGSAVCGLAGVVLLVVSGIVFLFRIRKDDGISSTSAPTCPRK
ncbi:uncharacterized protein [Henckelia pumila]|uniref:uncharacterized protein n=1 Tax=Henckelia pumila TaxID=405737 RepID=UPI003C6DC696